MTITNHSDLIRSAVRTAHADYAAHQRRMSRDEFIRNRVRGEVGEMDVQEVAVMEAEIQALRLPLPEGPVYRLGTDGYSE